MSEHQRETIIDACIDLSVELHEIENKLRALQISVDEITTNVARDEF